MLQRKPVFPHVSEMDYQAGRRIGCGVYLVYDGPDWILIDIGFEESVDEIVELYLGLCLEFKDMEQLFGVPDVHGALWVNERRIGIDQQLDPDKFPAKLGRYHFTLAHEAGHWRLHRQLFQQIGRASCRERV